MGGRSLLGAEEIANLYNERVRDDDPLFTVMRMVREQYNAAWITPLDQIDQNVQASTANLLLQGIDQLARRAASTFPHPDFQPSKPGNDASEKRARIRGQATVGWWEANRMQAKLRVRARHMLAYARTGAMVTPTFRRLGGNSDGGPRWRVLDPLLTYPAPRSELDDPLPDDTISVWRRPYRWLTQRYAVAGTLGDVPADTMYDLLYFASAEQISLVLIGKSQDQMWSTVTRVHNVMLENAPNRAERPLAVVPNLYGLDMPRTSFSSQVGLARQKARLDALTLLAIERGIYPETWAVANPGERVQIESEADGPMGEIGIISGGKLETIQVQPAYRTELMVDRLERQERLEGGIPAEFGGESSTNVRTGRRGESIMSATIDPRVQELQEILAESLVEEDKAAIAIERAYFGDSPRRFYFGRSGSSGRVDYRPARDFRSDWHTVLFPVTGADVNYLRVGIGQLLGLGLISQESARRLDPMVRDAEGEKDRITAEALEMAVLSALQQQAAAPDSPLSVVDVAWIAGQVKANQLDLFQAIEEAQRRAQERQAQAVPEGVPQAQPGIGGPGAAQPTAEGPESIEALLARMRNPQTTVAVR